MTCRASLKFSLKTLPPRQQAIDDNGEFDDSSVPIPSGINTDQAEINLWLRMKAKPKWHVKYLINILTMAVFQQLDVVFFCAVPIQGDIVTSVFNCVVDTFRNSGIGGDGASMSTAQQETFSMNSHIRRFTPSRGFSMHRGGSLTFLTPDFDVTSLDGGDELHDIDAFDLIVTRYETDADWPRIWSSIAQLRQRHVKPEVLERNHIRCPLHVLASDMHDAGEITSKMGLTWTVTMV